MQVCAFKMRAGGEKRGSGDVWRGRSLYNGQICHHHKSGGRILSYEYKCGCNDIHTHTVLSTACIHSLLPDQQQSTFSDIMSNYKSLIGKSAPPFKLKNYDGQDYGVNPGKTGLPLVIFFYPESGQYMRCTAPKVTMCPFLINTGSYGCTQQACQFRDAVTSESCLVFRDLAS